MPYYDKGTLADIIPSISSEQEAIEYFRQILYAIYLLHSINIIHRDIKPENILAAAYFDPMYPYKLYFAIADFGLAKGESVMNTKCAGTPTYMAPEVATGRYGKKADVFSLGCLLF